MVSEEDMALGSQKTPFSPFSHLLEENETNGVRKGSKFKWRATPPNQKSGQM